MKSIGEDLLRSVATFGITASITTLAYMLWSGARITSDDSYIMGMSVGVVVGAILLVTLFCERAGRKKVALWVWMALYALLVTYAVFVMLTAELHGPGIVALILGGSLLFGALELGLLRRIRSLYFNAVGVPLAIAFVALFTAVYL